MTADSKHKMAIVGGGISGLASAFYAIEAGQDPATIDIYEKSNRWGGQIQNREVGGQVVDGGAEFIDRAHGRLIELCTKNLGLTLLPAGQKISHMFQTPSGELLSAETFCKAYAPITEQVIRDRNEVEKRPRGKLAHFLDVTSIDTYLNLLQKKIPLEEYLAGQKNSMHKWGKKDCVSSDILEVAKNVYAVESGRPASKISALQFIHETSPNHERFLQSDFAYRVKGGMGSVIDALHTKLEAEGVHFHPETELQEIKKNRAKYKLSFMHKGETKSETVDKLVLAIPSYAIGQVKGLDAIGMHPRVQELLKTGQYTKSLKFSVKMQGTHHVAEQGHFYSNQLFQAWCPKPDIMTFFCNTEHAENQSILLLAASCLRAYAQAYGKEAGDIFDSHLENFALSNPGKTPCYAAPAPGQTHAFMLLREEFKKLAHGVAIVGTFVPDKSGTIGFVEGGLELAIERIPELVNGKRSKPLEKLLAKNITTATSLQVGVT